MKNFNWLIKQLFYKHTEEEATPDKTGSGIFYEVGFVDQLHANLCTNASESMLNHFAGKPFATMTSNPRGAMESAVPDEKLYRTCTIKLEQIEAVLKKSGPFIMSLPLKYHVEHSVVVTGCSEMQIVYNDPLTDGHRMIDHHVLKSLCTENSGRIEIATARFFNPTQLVNKVKSLLPAKPASIIPKKHQRFFSLEKMSDPCKAVLHFLQEYTQFSLWHLGRHHKAAIRQFIKNNQDVSDLNTLMLNLNNAFPKEALNNQGELFKRLLTIREIMNQHNANQQYNIL